MASKQKRKKKKKEVECLIFLGFYHLKSLKRTRLINQTEV
jgi:hypothetical protein